jgi:O-antigen/teichoic acid export membrane protein
MSAPTHDAAGHEERPGLGRSVALTTVALMGGRVLALVAGIALVTLASRYLGLADYGALTAGMAYASLFAILTDLGLSTVATREISRDPDREHEVLGTVLGVGAGLAVLAAGLGLALMEVIYGGTTNAATREAIVILLVQVLVAPVTGATRAFFTARQRGYLIALGDITLAIGMALFTAVAVAADLGYRGVVVAVTAGYVAQAAVMGLVALRAGGCFRPHARGARRMVRVALPLAGTLLLNYLYFRLDILLLSWLKSDVDVARYGLAYRVLEGLMVLPSYVMLALFPAISRAEDDPPRLAAIVGVAWSGLETAAVGFAALTAIFSPEIVVVLGGSKYSPAAPVLAILAAALGISYLSGVFGNALMALGRQRTLFWVTLGPLGVNLVLNLALIPPLDVVGAAIAVVVSELVGLVMIQRSYVKVAGPARAPSHARIALAAAPLAVIAALKFWLVPTATPLLVIVLGGGLGLVLYAGALLGSAALPREILDLMPLPRRLQRTRAPR